jgi:hypothetical protein
MSPHISVEDLQHLPGIVAAELQHHSGGPGKDHVVADPQRGDVAPLGLALDRRVLPAAMIPRPAHGHTARHERGRHVLTGLVALPHLGFLVPEMFYWDHPVGRQIFQDGLGPGGTTDRRDDLLPELRGGGGCLRRSHGQDHDPVHAGAAGLDRGSLRAGRRARRPAEVHAIDVTDASLSAPSREVTKPGP